jgi:hypothetical protein
MGVLQGAGTGAAIGSVVPGIGTVAGGVIGGLASLLGSWLSHRGQRNQINDQNRLAEEQHRRWLEEQRQAQLAQYNMGRGTFERGAAGQAVRGSVGGDLLSRYFKNLDPALLERIRTATPYPNFEFAPGGGGPPTMQAAPGFTGFAGNMLSGIAPYIGLDQKDPQSPIDQYMATVKHPDLGAESGTANGGQPIGSLTPSLPEVPYNSLYQYPPI